ncbi:hypothetical protein BHM03_00019395 [Ensete ventricosum]|nr:hypothetical protein BHM03_00019395 [Ensete ventricosum]
MRLETRQECIRSSLRVSKAYQDGTRMAQESSLEEDRDSPKDYRGYRAKDWMIQRELTGSSLGDLPKGSGSSLETHWEITGGRS